MLYGLAYWMEIEPIMSKNWG